MRLCIHMYSYHVPFLLKGSGMYQLDHLMLKKLWSDQAHVSRCGILDKSDIQFTKARIITQVNGSGIIPALDKQVSVVLMDLRVSPSLLVIWA